MQPEDSGTPVVSHPAVVKVNRGGKMSPISPLGSAPFDPGRISVMAGFLQEDHLGRDADRVVAHGVQTVFGESSDINRDYSKNGIVAGR